ARRRRADAGNPRERSIRSREVRQRLFQRQHSGSGPLEAEHLLPRVLDERQIPQQATDDRIHVAVQLDGHPTEYGICNENAEVSMPRYGKSASKNVERTMRRRKRGTLKSSSGRRVKSRKQAIAIALNESRRKGGKVPRKSSRGRSRRRSSSSRSRSHKSP